MKRRRVLKLIGVGGLTGLNGCVGGQGSENQTTESSTPTKEPPTWYKCQESNPNLCSGNEDYGNNSSQPLVEIANWGFLPQDNSVVGVLENVSHGSLSCASVEACFFDSNDKLMGIATNQRDGMEEKATWNFEITYSGDRQDSVDDAEVQSDASSG